MTKPLSSGQAVIQRVGVRAREARRQWPSWLKQTAMEYGKVNDWPEDQAIRQREGDQPLPVPNDAPSVQDAVIADIEVRKALGLARYKTLLQPHNQRDALLDLYQELLDASMYAKQLLIERDGHA